MYASPAAPGLVQTFVLIIGGLCRAMAGRCVSDRSARPVLMLAYARLCRTVQRFTALVARVQAGPLPPPRRRTRRPRSGPPRTPDPLPRSFAWLAQLVPGAACFGSQLQHFLAGPEAEALLQAAPQAGRLVRPLCRMLAAQVPPAWRLPPRPPRPPQPRPARPQPARPRPASRPPPEAAEASAPAPDPAPPPDGGRVYVVRRWRGIRMPELLRPPAPARETPA